MNSRIREDIPAGERIFCNRSLNMWSIDSVGFDMDYTLVMYKPEEFEKLAYDETIKKLVQMGYPSDLLNWHFDHSHMIRGLVIDKKRGNILKIDRHRYVKVAFHGFEELSRNERRKIYDLENVINYEEPDYVLIDTVFVFAEAYLFTQLVDFKEKTKALKEKTKALKEKTKALKEKTKALKEKTFAELYTDIKKCIDLVHRDGSLKNKVALNPSQYIKKDPLLIDVLEGLKLSGKSLFLLTNSLWSYTDVVMKFVMSKDDELNHNWTQYFDVIITGAQKPHFFKLHTPLYEVDLETNFLKNTEVVKKSTKVFQGGHVKLLHEMLDIKKGSQILYIGDHIYGDILRSKKEIGWRTMLVIDELSEEVGKISSLADKRQMFNNLCALRENKDDEYTKLKLEVTTLKHKNSALQATRSVSVFEEKIEKMKESILLLKEQEKKALQNYQRSFHPLWGQIMKTGNQNSRFSAQVINYSCLYTSKLSNLYHYGINKNFQASHDNMPHDLDN